MGFTRGLLGTTAPAADLRAAIESLLPGAGWVLVDTYTATTPADDIRVWHNPAANNVSGIDFYVGIGIPAGFVDRLYTVVAHSYNVATREITKYAPTATYAHTFDATDYTVSPVTTIEASIPETGTSTTYANKALRVVHIVSTVGEGYAALVTKDFIVYNGASNLNAGSYGFVGAFVRDSAFPADKCIGHYYAGTYTSVVNSLVGSTTQYANRTTADTHGFTIAPILDGMSGLTYFDRLNNQKPYTTRCAFAQYTGHYRGYLRDVLFLPASFTNYDDDMTMTINGTVHTFARMSSTIWVNKAAV